MTILEENAMRAMKQIPTLLSGIEAELKRIADALEGRSEARTYPKETEWVCPPNPTYDKSNKED